MGRTAAAGLYACGDVASVTRGAAPSGRVEHWTAAAAGARAVAYAIVGAPSPPDTPAYFWTDQFGSRLQVVGRPDRSCVPEIDDGEGWFVARYRGLGGNLRAVALLNRPDLLPDARREVAAAVVPAPAAVA